MFYWGKAVLEMVVYLCRPGGAITNLNSLEFVHFLNLRPCIKKYSEYFSIIIIMMWLILKL